MRVFDAEGQLRSVRAMRVTDGDTPKRLPPAGHKAAGLLMLNADAWKIVARGAAPDSVFIVEGVPDMLYIAAALPRVVEAPIIGLVSGGWSDEWAAKMPMGATVYIWTHDDEAGEGRRDALSGKHDHLRHPERSEGSHAGSKRR